MELWVIIILLVFLLIIGFAIYRYRATTRAWRAQDEYFAERRRKALAERR